MNTKKEKISPRTWIEIDTKAISHNYKIFKSLISPSTKLCSVVKSNAYGSDFLQFSNKMVELGVDFLAVDSIVEGISLRNKGIKHPILILGHTLPNNISEAIKNNLTISVSNFETLKKVCLVTKDFKYKPKIHIKVDTGMSRQGFLEKDKEKLIKILKINKEKIEIEGLFTHFASAKNPSLSHDTDNQVKRFLLWKKLFYKIDIHPIVHASASSGTLLYPKYHFDMVRIGISMYGLWPSLESREYLKDKITLKPILSWKTIIGEIKIIPKGQKIGYDFTETLEKETKIAICPVGYWHGISRKLSGIGRVLINGKKSRIIGKISMDMLAIDITDIKNVKVGNEVVLIGSQKTEEISVYEMASLDDTSWYETVTRINPLIKRIYI